MNLLDSAIMLGITEEVVIPENLQNFLSFDDQGIDGLMFMFKDPKLCNRIPENVRMEYKVLCGKLNFELEQQITQIRNQLDKISANPKSIIHAIIDDIHKETK